MTDEIHEHGAADDPDHPPRPAHGWDQADWLPVVAPSPLREPAHRTFPKEAEDWDIDRIVGDYADAAERMQAGGMDGIEIESYGHLFDQFWSPPPTSATDEYGGSFDNRHALRHCACSTAIRERVGPDFIVGIRMAVDERVARRHRRDDGLRDPRPPRGRRADRLRQRDPRPHRDDAALTDVIPIHGMRSAPHLDFAGEVRGRHRPRRAPRVEDRRRRDRPPCDPRGPARHRRHDPRPHRRSAHRAQDRRAAARPRSDRASAPPTASTASTRPARRCASTTRRRPRGDDAARDPAGARPGAGSSSSAPGPADWRRRAWRGERGHDVTVLEAMPWAGGQIRLAVRNPRRRT